MDSKNYDWSKFIKKISINASPEILYQAWTTQENIEKWFLAKAEFKTPDGTLRKQNQQIQEGDTFEWMWHGSDVVERGKMLAVNKKDKIRFTFYDCFVDVIIKTDAGENIVELTQSEIPLTPESRVNQHLGCMRGWTFYMTNLKSILEGGIDLRNKNKNLTNVINT